MPASAKSKSLQDEPVGENGDLSRYVPREFGKIDHLQTAIPGIAEDARSIQLIEKAFQASRFHSMRGMNRLTSIAGKECVLARVSFRLHLFDPAKGHY